eukprot:scaffold85284_cov36-Phaeocystis_antarctica.AAC.1
MFEVRGPGAAVAAEIAAATEAMLRYLLRAYPATAILLVDACCLPPGKRLGLGLGFGLASPGPSPNPNACWLANPALICYLPPGKRNTAAKRRVAAAY